MQWPASALIAATLSSALAAEPAMFRGDARHGGVYDAAGVAQLHGVKWTSVVVGDTIYFGSWDGQLYAIG